MNLKNITRVDPYEFTKKKKERKREKGEDEERLEREAPK
jgi:hypothetical protein